MGKAAGKHHFLPTSWKKGKPLEDLSVGITYKARSNLIFALPLFFSVIALTASCRKNDEPLISR